MGLLLEKAKAKINLTLDVIRKRTDGYHEVEMVMQSVDLCDRLTFQQNHTSRIELSSNISHIPLDERNLVYKAAELIRQEYGIKSGVAIYIDKHIPVAAGLAGGSSDAAATLRGLNQFWNLGLSFEQLRMLGSRIGSDVPFCIEGGTAIATGRGERLESITPLPPFWIVLVKPSISVSTADVYRNLKIDEITEHPSAERMTEAICTGDLNQVADCLGNVLESVTFKMHPEVEKIKQQLIKFGAAGALMSGSGPTLYGLVDREAKAMRMYHALRGFAREVYVTRCC